MLNGDSISKPMFVPPSETMTRPLFDRVHEWIVTVDHKKLGLMYIGYGILFLGDRGPRSHSDADSVGHPE